MIFYYLDKAVDYRLKQKNKEIKKEIIVKDIKNFLNKKKKDMSLAFVKQAKKKFLKNNDDYKTIFLSRKEIIKIKEKYNPIIAEYALAKELSEKGFTTLEQSIITKNLKKNNII